MPQLNSNVEVIIVDDGSTDDSLSICQGYAREDSRIRIIQQENKGLSGARNTGIRHATGTYIWFVDSDDWIEDRAVNTLLEYIAQHPSLDIIRFGFTLCADETGEIVEEYSYDQADDVLSNVYFQQHEMLYQAWAGVYKRSFLERNDIWFPEGMIYEDIPFNLRVYTAQARMSVLPGKYYGYRVRNGSLLRSAVNKKKIDSVAHILAVCDELIGKFTNNQVEATVAIRKKLDYIYVFIDHLHAYNEYSDVEKIAAFRKLNLNIPILKNDSKGLIWTKLQLRVSPRSFYKKRVKALHAGI